MGNNLFSAFVVALATAGLSGCGPNIGGFGMGGDEASENVVLHQTVWSEDAAAFAYMRFSYESTDGFLSFGFGTDNHIYELYVSDRKQKKTTRLMSGQAESILSRWEVKHYMREAGYVLVRHEEFASGVAPRFLRVSLNGTITEAGKGSDLEMIPSPDGSRIAEVRGSFNSYGCAYPTLQTIVTCSFRIRFLNATTLEPEWPEDSALFEYGGESGGILRAKPVPVWSPEGEFFLSNGHEAIRVVPGQAIVRQGPRACRAPATASSDISKNRELIVWGGKSFDFRPAADSLTTFGCP